MADNDPAMIERDQLIIEEIKTTPKHKERSASDGSSPVLKRLNSASKLKLFEQNAEQKLVTPTDIALNVSSESPNISLLESLSELSFEHNGFDASAADLSEMNENEHIGDVAKSHRGFAAMPDNEGYVDPYFCIPHRDQVSIADYDYRRQNCKVTQSHNIPSEWKNDFLTVIKEMEFRKKTRAYHGHYKGAGRKVPLVVFAIICVICGLFSMSLCTEFGRLSINLWFGQSDSESDVAQPSVLYITVLVVTILAIVIFALLILWSRAALQLKCSLWISLLFLVVLLIAFIANIGVFGVYDTFDLTKDCTGPLSNHHRYLFLTWILLAFLIVQYIFFFGVWIHAEYYPLAVKKGYFGLRHKWLLTEYSPIKLLVPTINYNAKHPAKRTSNRCKPVRSATTAEYIKSNIRRVKDKLLDLGYDLKEQLLVRPRNRDNTEYGDLSFKTNEVESNHNSDCPAISIIRGPEEKSSFVENNGSGVRVGKQRTIGSSLSPSRFTDTENNMLSRTSSFGGTSVCTSRKAADIDSNIDTNLPLTPADDEPGEESLLQYHEVTAGHLAWYVGQVDENGLPHGFGRWKEESQHGEELLGIWHHGIPQAPFKAREYGSGSGFTAVKLGWASFGRDNTLTWGVAKAECSVSGAFFRQLPDVDSSVCPMSYRSAFLVSSRDKRRGQSGGVMDSTQQTSSWQNFWNFVSKWFCCNETKGISIKDADIDDFPLNNDFLSKRKNRLYKKLMWRNAEWVASELRRNGQFPNFGQEPCTNLTLGVDSERGVYVSGHIPVPMNHLSRRSASSIFSGVGYSNAACVDAASMSSHIVDEADSCSGINIRVIHKCPVVDNVESTTSKRACQGTPLQSGAYEGPELVVNGWVQAELAGHPEGLIFIHGYNCLLKHNLGSLGQTAAFAHFPSYIKTFVFNWPCGLGVKTFFEARKWSMSDDTTQAFLLFMSSLRNLGIRQFHIMAHSMGSRVFLYAMKRAFQRHPGLFRKIDSIGGRKKPIAENKSMQILTMTFMNPEYFLDDFLDEFPALRHHCAHITVFADSQDGALWWSEIFSRKPALGKSVFGFRQSAKNGKCGDFAEPPESRNNRKSRYRNTASQLSHADNKPEGTNPPPIDGELKGSNESKDPTGKAGDGNRVGSPKHWPISTAARRFGSTFKAYRLDTPKSRKKLNLAPRSISRYFNVPDIVDDIWLDLDVIDTSFMDQNVGGMRHVFFNLNREVIEDLRELMLQRKRAHQRTSRLDRRQGNVWVYRVAPSFLKSLYDW